MALGARQPVARLISGFSAALLVRARLCSSPLGVAVVVTAAYAAFAMWRLTLAGGDPSMFIVAGPPATDPATALPNVHVYAPGTTYDGQYFYRLALEPWTRDRTDHGVTFDSPLYRQGRILYPLVAWGISLGDWRHTPAALIVANLLAVGVLAYAAAAFAVRVGRYAFAAVLIPMYPGYLATISRDLAELTEAAAMCVGLVLVQRGRFRLAAAALTASALARESALGLPIAGVLWWAMRRARRESSGNVPLGVWLAPIVVYAVWSRLLALRWGDLTFIPGDVNFAWPPLSGLATGLQQLGERGPDWRIDLGLLALVLVAVMGVVVTTLTRPRLLASPLPIACLLYAGLALFYSALIWRDEAAYPRALHEVWLTASLALLSGNVWIIRFLTIPTLWLWLAIALNRATPP